MPDTACGHPAALRFTEFSIPREERRRVLWRDDADADRTATGVTVKRQCVPRGPLVRVLIRLDADPAGPLVAVSPNDLEDLGPADAEVVRLPLRPRVVWDAPEPETAAGGA